MNVILRILPFFVGSAVGYTVLIGVAAAGRPVRFSVAALLVLGMGHAFTGFNTFMLRRQGAVLAPRSVADRWQGHLLMLAAALSAGYVFAFGPVWVVAVTMACLWFADDKLTPRVTGVRAPVPPDEPPAGQLRATEQAMLDATLASVKGDSILPVVRGADVVLERLTGMLAREAGGRPQPESVLCALGALAGYACQAGLREVAREQGLEETAPFVVISTASGARYFYGDPLNHALLEGQASVWKMAARALEGVAPADLPDPGELFAHVASSVGGPSFGIPRIPAPHAPAALPLDLLTRYWPTLGPVARKFCPTPAEWPILFSIAIRDVIPVVADQVPPRIAFAIAMEAAVPMSKVELAVAGTPAA